MINTKVRGVHARRRRGQFALVSSIAVLAALCGTIDAAPALASSPRTPAIPQGVRVAKVGHTSFTVTAHRTKYAQRYRLFAALKPGELGIARIAAAYSSAAASSPRLTIHGLPYTTAPYYFRIEAMDGSKVRFSHEIPSAALRPATPTQLQTGTSGNGTFLSWQAQPAQKVVVERATNPSMTGQTRSYTVPSSSPTFTPYGLHQGTKYYYRVKAANASSASTYSRPVQASAAGAEQPVRVMTYNILEASKDGHVEGGQRIASWPARRAAAVSLIRAAHPDAIAIQEGADWVDHRHREREVDSLRKALGSPYRLAHTEIAPDHRHYFRTGVYVIYNKDSYKAVGHGGHWALGNRRWAAYQVLENRASHARMLFVAPHLLVGNGRNADDLRAAETRVLLRKAEAKASHAHAAVVYAGDFNSHPGGHVAYDGPGAVMSSAHIADAMHAAQHRANARFDSANQYRRTPPAYGQDIDHVYAPSGVGVSTCQLLMRLSHGRFVGTIPSDHNPLECDLTIPY